MRWKPSAGSSPAETSARPGKRCWPKRGSAPAATCTRPARRRCSAKAPSTPPSCSSASSRATRRIWPADPSSARPASCSQTYVTNAVKHFKFEARGKRRIHSKPDAGEIEACRWWQEQERALIKPPLTVALGATAARSLTGRTVTISRAREAPLTLADGSECWVTVHPSFLLRIPEEDRKAAERARFVEDLRRIKARADELTV
jgi:uracil-DNA glycosylase family 4